MLDYALIGARFVHFASTVAVAGVLVFLCCVGEPAFGAGRDIASPAIARLRTRLLRTAWVGLAVSIASAAAWLLLLSAQISGLSMAQALSGGIVDMVLAQTQFGRTWEVRLALAIVLAAALAGLGNGSRAWSSTRGLLAAVAAACLLGTLVWAGHGGAAPGVRGRIQAAADFLHLVAVGGWLGALAPLVLVFAAAEGSPARAWAAIARAATLRFSTLGMVAVATLVVTGSVNTWALLGGVRPLFETSYGRVLLLKIALFLCMFAVAAVNRLRWTPRLCEAAPTDPETFSQALRRLKSNTLIEAALGVAVLLAVSVLGTMEPASMMMDHGL